MTDDMASPPPVPADADLRDFDGFMLNTERLLASELWAISSGDEFKAAMGLWCRAWKQIPAGSLPNDERVLAAFSGAGKAWKRVRDVALRGFQLCDDGRLYHRVLCDDVLRALRAKKERHERTQAATEARQRKRDEQRDVVRDVPTNHTVTKSHRQDREVDRDKTRETSGVLSNVVGSLTKPVNGVAGKADYDDRAVRKQRWQQKIANELHRTLPTERAERIITAYADGEEWAKIEFEKVDQYIKQRRSVAGGMER